MCSSRTAILWLSSSLRMSLWGGLTIELQPDWRRHEKSTGSIARHYLSNWDDIEKNTSSFLNNRPQAMIQGNNQTSSQQLTTRQDTRKSPDPITTTDHEPDRMSIHCKNKTGYPGSSCILVLGAVSRYTGCWHTRTPQKCTQCKAMNAHPNLVLSFYNNINAFNLCNTHMWNK